MNNQNIQPLPHVVVAAVILQVDGKILLTRRKYDVHQGGLWEFPGGKQEGKETLEQCVRRELKEELAITVGPLRYAEFIRHCYPEKEVEIHFFSCWTYEGRPVPLECLEFAWVSPADLPAYEFPAADQPIITKIIQGKI